MKFCYCQNCKQLRPKSWYQRGDCLLCGEKCSVFEVPMSIYGYAMYVLSAIGASFLGMELMEIDLGIGDLRLYIMFGAILLAMLFSYLELDRTTKIARERVGKMR